MYFYSLYLIGDKSITVNQTLGLRMEKNVHKYIKEKVDKNR